MFEIESSCNPEMFAHPFETFTDSEQIDFEKLGSSGIKQPEEGFFQNNIQPLPGLDFGAVELVEEQEQSLETFKLPLIYDRSDRLSSEEDEYFPLITLQSGKEEVCGLVSSPETDESHANSISGIDHTDVLARSLLQTSVDIWGDNQDWNAGQVDYNIHPTDFLTASDNAWVGTKTKEASMEYRGLLETSSDTSRGTRCSSRSTLNVGEDCPSHEMSKEGRIPQVAALEDLYVLEPPTYLPSHILISKINMLKVCTTTCEKSDCSCELCHVNGVDFFGFHRTSRERHVEQ